MKKRHLIFLFTILIYSSCSKDNPSEPLPTAHFTITGQSGFVKFNDIHFTNYSKNAQSYIWDFGDGNCSTNENPIHQYRTAKKYKVTLTALNETGSDTTSMSLDIEESSANIETIRIK